MSRLPSRRSGVIDACSFHADLILVAGANIRKFQLVFMIGQMGLDRINPHVIQAAEFRELMKRRKKIRHIKCSTSNFDRPDNFAMFKSIEISGINEMS